MRPVMRITGLRAAAAALLLWAASCGMARSSGNGVAGEDAACESGAAGCSRVAGEGEGVSLRLRVEPAFGLMFGCVAFGCRESRDILITGETEQAVAIPTVRLGLDTSSDFVLRVFDTNGDALRYPTPAAPLVLEQNDYLVVRVTYTPSDADVDTGVVWLDWYNASLEPGSVTAERLLVSLATRRPGEPSSELSHDSLDFGFVSPGQSRSMSVELASTGPRSAVLEVVDLSLSEDSDPAFGVEPLDTAFINGGETAEVSIVFSPSAEGLATGTLVVTTNEEREPYEVTLIGTSIAGGRLAVANLAGGVLDFGVVRQGESARLPVELLNIGSKVLAVQLGFDASSSPAFALDEAGLAELLIPSLRSAVVQVAFTPTSGETLAGVLELRPSSGDPISIDVTGIRQAPEIETSQLELAFGMVVQGWSVPPQTLTLHNRGVGPLTIRTAELELGSSALLAITSDVGLPLALSPADPATTVSVGLQTHALGPVAGSLLIESDAIADSVLRVPVSGEVVTCEIGCPLANAVPACAQGSCQVGSCTGTWHDADGEPENGCECGEDRGGDIGANCIDAYQVPSVGDGCTDYPAEALVSGTLHESDDVDVFFVQMFDGGAIFCDTFGDSFRLQVALVDAPPGLRVCVSVRSEDAGCANYTTTYSPEDCYDEAFVHDGTAGPSDSSDVTVSVLWEPGFAPACAPYTIKFRAKD